MHMVSIQVSISLVLFISLLSLLHTVSGITCPKYYRDIFASSSSNNLVTTVHCNDTCYAKIDSHHKYFDMGCTANCINGTSSLWGNVWNTSCCNRSDCLEGGFFQGLNPSFPEGVELQHIVHPNTTATASATSTSNFSETSSSPFTSPTNDPSNDDQQNPQSLVWIVSFCVLILLLAGGVITFLLCAYFIKRFCCVKTITVTAQVEVQQPSPGRQELVGPVVSLRTAETLNSTPVCMELV